MSAQRGVRWVAVGLLILGLMAFALSCGRKAEKIAEQTPAAAPNGAQPRVDPRGQEAYLAYCAMCHGEWGEGDGPLAEQLQKQSGIRPAHLNDRARLGEMGRQELVHVIERGGAHTGRSNLMPPWGERLDADVINHIADFVMTLPDLKPGIPASTIEKYLQAPPGTPAEGRKLFVFYCTICHGPYGKGDGLLADTLRARNNIRPRNLTDSLYLAKKTDQELYATVSLGGGHMGKSVFMPAWTVTLTPSQIKDLVSYVRAISHTASRP